jgi:osmotically-inducible protein OsmY
MTRAACRLANTAIVAALALLPACGRRSDPTESIDKALKSANLERVSVDWDGAAGVAHLKGSVDRPSDRQRAEEVANAAVGTAGRVLNEVTIRGLNEHTAGNLDGDIKRQLKKMLDSDPVLRDRAIAFEVNNGAVTVKGDVQTADEKARLTELVRAAPGVKDFVNAAEIKPNP